MIPLLFLFVIFDPAAIADSASASQERRVAEAASVAVEESEFRSLAQIVRIMEASQVTYSILPLSQLELNESQLLDAVFPLQGLFLENPTVVDGKLINQAIDQKEYKRLEKAEKAFSAKDYTKARHLYEKALKKFPNSYFGRLNLGDTYLFSGDARTALTHYQIAAELNPSNFLSYYYMGNAHMRLEAWSDAKEAYITALTLYPRRHTVVKTLEQAAPLLEVEIHEDFFHPRGFARKTKAGVDVVVDLEHPMGRYWMSYAMTDAVWKGESSDQEVWTSRQGLECLGNLVEGYHKVREGGESPRSEVIERVEAIIKAGDVDGFLWYEIGSRYFPHITLMDAGIRQSVDAYIRKYVVVDLP